MNSKPIDKSLYKYVKKLANERFNSSNPFKSRWMLQKYKSLGGRFKKTSKVNIKLKKNYKEKWISTNNKKVGGTNKKKTDEKHVTFKIPLVNYENKNQQIGGENGKPQYYGKRSSVMVSVPENVKKAALYSFKLKKVGFKGGLETGWKRAKQLSTQSEIPIQDLKYMRAWYARHLYASYPSYKAWKNAGMPRTPEWFNKHGIISWLIWGGSPGFKWVNSQKNINLLNEYYNKDYKSNLKKI